MADNREDTLTGDKWEPGIEKTLPMSSAILQCPEVVEWIKTVLPQYDFSKMKKLGSGANGKAYKLDNVVVKVTVDEHEIHNSGRVLLLQKQGADIHPTLPYFHGVAKISLGTLHKCYTGLRGSVAAEPGVIIYNFVDGKSFDSESREWKPEDEVISSFKNLAKTLMKTPLANATTKELFSVLQDFSNTLTSNLESNRFISDLFMEIDKIAIANKGKGSGEIFMSRYLWSYCKFANINQSIFDSLFYIMKQCARHIAKFSIDVGGIQLPKGTTELSPREIYPYLQEVIKALAIGVKTFQSLASFLAQFTTAYIFSEKNGIKLQDVHFGNIILQNNGIYKLFDLGKYSYEGKQVDVKTLEEKKMENDKELVQQRLVLNATKEQQLDESWLAGFGSLVKDLLSAMFKGSSIPVKIVGTEPQVNAFSSALFSEKNYMSSWRKYGLDDARTYRNKSALDAAINKFQRATGLEWPFKE